MTLSSARRDLVGATSADVATKLLGYVVLATLARVFSPDAMGELFFAMALAQIVSMLTELGTGRYLVREVAERGSGGLEDLSDVLALRLPAAALGLVLLNGIALLLMPDRAAIVFLTSVFLIVGDLYYAFGSFFVGLRRIGARILTGLIEPVLLVVLVLVAVRAGWELRAVLLCYVSAALTRVAVGALVVRLSVGPLRPSFDPVALRRVAAESFPFFLLGFLGLILLKVDTLMILLFRTAEEVAHYESAYKFLEVSRFAVRSAAMVFFPRCARLAALGRWGDLTRLAKRLLTGAFGVGLIFGLGVVVLSPLLIPLVWGAAYDAAIPVLRILFVGLPALYVSFVGMFVAQALRLERAAVAVLVVGILANVVLNAAAIPRTGAEGAAWTSVVTEVGLAASLLVLVFRKLAIARRGEASAEVPTMSRV